MSEFNAPMEQDPGNYEADQASIELFEQTIQEVVATYNNWSFHPELGGWCSVELDESQKGSLEVEYTVFGSKGHPVEDWFFRQSIPNATSLWMRFMAEPRLTDDQLATHCEVEQIWVVQTPEGKQIRRRVYDHEQFNSALGDKVENQDYERLLELFKERRELRQRKQRESDAMEETMGLNRLTIAELHERIELLKDHSNFGK